MSKNCQKLEKNPKNCLFLGQFFDIQMAIFQWVMLGWPHFE